MKKSSVKGWCPGAYQPMVSGDGLIVRIRPKFAEFSSVQIKKSAVFLRNMALVLLNLPAGQIYNCAA